MNDRKTNLAFLVAALLLEGFLVFRGGVLAWFASGPHSEEQLRAFMFDWRTVASVALVTVILWLAYRLVRSGSGRQSESREPSEPTT